MLDRHGARLSAIYRFGDLMLSEGGFTLLPPVVAETRRRLPAGAGRARAPQAPSGCSGSSSRRGW